MTPVYTSGTTYLEVGSVEMSLNAELINPCQLSGNSSMVLSIYRSATASAGDDATICYDESLALNASIESTQRVLWSTDGDGGFDDPASLNATYSPRQNDLDAGSVILTLTA